VLVLEQMQELEQVLVMEQVLEQVQEQVPVLKQE